MRVGGKRGALWILVAFLWLCGVAWATAPGQPDPSFNGGSATGPSNTQLLAVATRADGSVVAAGTSGTQAVVAEFSASGQLQRSFTAAGPVARGVALQSDGRIVVVGGNSIGGGGMIIERLNPDGTPDSSFGSGGVVNLLASPSGESDGQANAVAIQPDGKIVVAGTALGSDGFPRAALVRLNGNGSLDAGFAGGGIDILDLGRYSEANALTLQADGRMVLGGTARANLQSTNVIVARVNSNGSLDSGFAGGSGYFAWGFAIGSAVTYVNGVAVQSDGKIIAAGSAGDSSTGSDLIVFRLTSSGGLDSSFGSGGLYRTRATDSTDQYTQSLPAPGGAGVVIIGGKIVVAGYYDSYTATRFALWALTSSGQPDTGFGTGGRVLGPTGSQALAVTAAPGENLVLAGQSGGNGLVARYGAPTPESTPSPGPVPPVVTTGAPSSITATSATLNGSVNPEGLPTTYRFEYGPTVAYGSSTSSSSAGSGTSAVPASAALTGLAPGTTYHYRLVAGNSAGSSSGADQTFATLAAQPPLVGAETASAVKEVSARITAPIAPGGLPTAYNVQYGPSSVSAASTGSGSLPAGTDPVPVTVVLRGLKPGTTYHYRLVATNSAGTAYGSDQTFKTLPRLRGSVSGVARTLRLSMILKSGLKIHGSCSQACRMQGSLVIPTRVAKQLGLRGSGHQVTLAQGSTTLRRAGQRTLRIVFTRWAAQHLRRVHRPLSATLVVKLTPLGGGPAVTVSRTVVLTG